MRYPIRREVLGNKALEYRYSGHSGAPDIDPLNATM